MKQYAQIEREIEILNAQFGNLTKGMTTETFVTTPEMILLMGAFKAFTRRTSTENSRIF